MNSRIITALITIIVLIGSIYIGSLIGSENYESMSFYFVCACIIWFIIVGWKMTWQIVALFAFSGIAIYQGFNIYGNHLFALMVAFGSIIGLYKKQKINVPYIFRKAGNLQLNFFLLLFIFYGLFHAIYNYINPISELEYSINNATKAYFAVYASYALMLWLSNSYFVFILSKEWIRSFCVIISFSLIVNVIYMTSMLMLGYGDQYEYESHIQKDILSIFSIPIVNIYLSEYNLRTLTWQVIFISFLFLLNRELRNSLSLFSKSLLVFCIPLSIFGAIISGGRAALILCMFFVCIALFKNKRVKVILSGILIALLFIICINLFSSYINKAPLLISRPLQLMMIDKGSAYQSIVGSSETRDLAAEAGIKEWKSNDRIYWFGRSVYKYLGQEYYLQLKNQLGERGAFAEYSVRSATVHNLYGDILIQYGLIGAILYTIALISCVVYCINIYRYCKKYNMPPIACELSFFCASSIPVMFIIQIKGGGYFDVLYPLLIGIVRVIVSREEKRRVQEEFNNEKLLVNSQSCKLPI